MSSHFIWNLWDGPLASLTSFVWGDRVCMIVFVMTLLNEFCGLRGRHIFFSRSVVVSGGATTLCAGDYWLWTSIFTLNHFTIYNIGVLCWTYHVIIEILSSQLAASERRRLDVDAGWRCCIVVHATLFRRRVFAGYAEIWPWFVI